MHNIKFGNDWDQVLDHEVHSEYFEKLMEKVNTEYHQHTIFPKPENVFAALRDTSFVDTKVLILGQDPYHNVGQANGLSFSVSPGTKLPPSLQNIFKELKSDLGIERTNGDLSDWTKQGVMLLNATLTVAAHDPNSHSKIGWQPFTDHIIKKLSDRGGVVFVLWGNYAKMKIPLIDQTKNVIISSPHPSPFSANKGFFGSRPFSKINAALEQYHETKIDW